MASVSAGSIATSRLASMLSPSITASMTLPNSFHGAPRGREIGIGLGTTLEVSAPVRLVPSA